MAMTKQNNTIKNLKGETRKNRENRIPSLMALQRIVGSQRRGGAKSRKKNTMNIKESDLCKCCP